MTAVRMQDKLEVCIKDWAELADEYKQLELAHKEYRNVSPALSLMFPSVSTWRTTMRHVQP